MNCRTMSYSLGISVLVLVGLGCLLSAQQQPLEGPEKTNAQGNQQASQNKPSQTSQPQAMSKEDSDATDMATKLFKGDLAWMQNKLSTPGTSVELHEVSRKRTDGKLVVQYEAFVKGAPTDQIYRYLNWPINQSAPSTDLEGVTIGNNGLVICAGRTPGQCSGEKPDDPVDLTFLPAKGELYRLAFVSANDSVKILFAVVPDPIVASNKGCSLEVVRLMAKFELGMLRGKGFEPNQEVQFWGESYGESHTLKAKTDANGEYVAALLPFVKGKTSGKMDLSLKSASCSPSLSFEWGK